METLEINGHKWKKFKGDEGQDVYVSLTPIDQNKLVGKYVDSSFYDILVENDTDFYISPPSVTGEVELTEDNVAFKFRKNVFTNDEQLGAVEGLYDAAVESNNRGMAAGPREEKSGARDWVTPFQMDILDYYIKGKVESVDGSDRIQDIIEEHKNIKYETRGSVWLRTKVEESYGDYSSFFPNLMEELSKMTLEQSQKVAKKIKETFISDTSYATAIWSGIAGFYGRYPRIPYGRATSYVDHNREKFEKSYPFARKLEAEFKRMMPVRWGRQNAYAQKLDKKFLIGEDTTFTTITVNTTTKDRNARMACHRDAGSLNPGFSNLTVVTKDGKDWKGGYLVTPEVRAAINIRPGDLLLIDNMRIIHGNTPIEAPDSGDDDMMRMSLVYYFREDMENLGSWEYETTRRNFVDDRRKNKEHPLWKEFWNGVSPGMWLEEEWYEYLESKMGLDALLEYHPESQQASLEGFF